MAVASVDQYAQDPYKAPTSPTVPKTNVTQTPTPTVQPQVAQQQAPRAAATTTLVPSQVPQMDPMAFSQPARSPYQDAATGNWDISSQAGWDAYAQWQAARAAGENVYTAPQTTPAPPPPPPSTFSPGVYNTSGVSGPNAGKTYLNPGQYAPQRFGDIDPSTFASMSQAQRDALAQQMIDYGYGFNQLQDITTAHMNDPGASFHGWVGGESLLDPADLAKFRQLTNTDSYGLLRSGAGRGYTADSWATLTPEQQATIASGGPSPADIDRANYQDSYRTIQGGQEFTDPALARDAFNKLQQSGDTLFTDLQPGGTWRPDALAQVQGGQTGGGVPGTSGAPGTPGTPGTPVDTGGSPVYPGGGASGGGDSGLGPTGTATDPEFDLRSLQILPGEMLDRFKLANEQYDTFADATSPQYQAALRDAARAAAATGRLGSGMLRTSYGDLANTRARELTNQRDTLFQNALLGSVQDAQTRFEDLLAEQQYQTGAQNQAFNQAVTAQRLQEELTSGAFNRALSQMIQGYANDPSQMSLTLSKIFGDQSSAAGQSLAMLMQGLGSGGDNTEMMKLLQTIRAGLEQRGQPVTQQGTPTLPTDPSVWGTPPSQFPTQTRPSGPVS